MHSYPYGGHFFRAHGWLNLSAKAVQSFRDFQTLHLLASLHFRPEITMKKRIKAVVNPTPVVRLRKRGWALATPLDSRMERQRFLAQFPRHVHKKHLNTLTQSQVCYWNSPLNGILWYFDKVMSSRYHLKIINWYTLWLFNSSPWKIHPFFS